MQSRGKGAAQLPQLSQFLWPLRGAGRLPLEFPYRKFVYPVIAAVTGPILTFVPPVFFGT